MNLNECWILLLLVGNFYVGTVKAEEATVPVASDTGKIRFGALLQAWGLNDTTSTSTKTNFRIRRAEIKFSGSVAEGSRWFLTMDPAKSVSTGPIVSTNDNKILQDLGIAFSPSKNVEIIFGQFKTPTTAEGLESSSELLLPERTLVGRGTSSDKVWGDRREPSFMVTYNESIWRAWAAVSNGQRTNVDDVTNGKDLHVRLEASPTDMIKIGAFTTAGDYSYAERGRWGLNTRINYSDLQIRAETVHAVDQGVKSNGWEADLSYMLTPEIQPVVRYEAVRNGIFEGNVTAVGMNYYYAKSTAKIQAAYSKLSNITGANGSYQLSQGSDGSLVVISFQTAI